MLILSATSKQRRGLAEDRTSPREKGRGKVHPGAPVKWLRLEQPQTGAGGTGTTGGGWPSPREGPGTLTLTQTWEDLEASPRSGRGLLLAVTRDARAWAGRSGAGPLSTGRRCCHRRPGTCSTGGLEPTVSAGEAGGLVSAQPFGGAPLWV